MHDAWSPATPDSRSQRDAALSLFRQTRAATERLVAPLSAEDQQLQSMPSASPTKWHLAHTSWFFEKTVLEPNGIEPFDPRYGELFNSYYVAFGPRHARGQRGLLSRPSLEQVRRYRAHVDAQVVGFLERASDAALASYAPLIELGVAHEEQHQELILTDILHALSHNPLAPVYAPPPAAVAAPPVPRNEPRAFGFIEHAGGLVHVGCDPRTGFCFDHEAPRHKRWLEPFALADRLVTIRELKAFMREGGYRTPSLWLSEGFDFVEQQTVRAPLYVREEGGELVAFGLHGERVLLDDEPVSHVSYYEADAIARFLGARLPTEVEWEHAARDQRIEGHFVERGVLHPLPARPEPQLFGGVWQWTASSYEAYPGFEPNAGALAEYNGKFMVNQRVLRGGSCLTPSRHLRASYRNFFHPETRFQMTGIRLARA